MIKFILAFGTTFETAHNLKALIS